MPNLKAPNFTILKIKGGEKEGLAKSLSDIQYQVTYDVPAGGTVGVYGLTVAGEVNQQAYPQNIPGTTLDPATAKSGKLVGTFDLTDVDIARVDGVWKASASITETDKVALQRTDGNFVFGNDVVSVRASSGFEAGHFYQKYVLDRYFHSVNYLPASPNDPPAAVSTFFHLHNPGNPDIYYVDQGTTDPGKPGDAQPTIGQPATAPTSVTDQTFISKKNPHIETNLRMLSRGFGGIRSSTDKDANGKSHPHEYGVKWRSGMIHTWEGAPAYDTFTHMYGFRFHYNPTSWTQNVQMTESIDPQNALGSKPINLPLMGGWAGVGLTVYVNRIIEMSMSVEQLQQSGVWSNDLSKYGDVGTPESNPVYVDADLLDAAQGANGDATGRAALARNRASIENKVTALNNYGTLADLEFLFKAVNGDGVRSYHRQFGFSKPPPGLDGKGDNTITADYGFLNAIPVRVWLGPHITFVGRITSVEISHLMFTERMIPKYSQVSLQIQRPLTWGDNLEESNKLLSSASTGDAKGNVLTPGTAQGGNTKP